MKFLSHLSPAIGQKAIVVGLAFPDDVSRSGDRVHEVAILPLDHEQDLFVGPLPGEDIRGAVPVSAFDAVFHGAGGVGWWWLVR